MVWPPPGTSWLFIRKQTARWSRRVGIDAFAGNRINRQEADELSGAQLADDDFTPASNRDIISRMLRNLIRSAEWEKDTTSILRYLDALIGIDPSG